MPTLLSEEDVHPALPILASTLLELEYDYKKTARDVGAFQTGVKRLDATLRHTLWMGGKVVGIVTGRGKSKLAEHLITTHLASLASSIPETDHNPPSAFVIAPPNTSIASTVHDLLQARPAIRTQNDCLQLLNTVKIMQYFDIVGLAESVSEVYSSLHGLKSDSGIDSSHISRQILLVDGLCPALEAIQRKSGSVQANALASSLLRSVTHLSRSDPSLLVLVNLEASGDARGVDELTSAFSSPEKSIRAVSPGGMLQRTLLAGIDTVILVHETADDGSKDGDVIVEVVKDRVGAGLGQWVVWPGSA